MGKAILRLQILLLVGNSISARYTPSRWDCFTKPIRKTDQYFTALFDSAHPAHHSSFMALHQDPVISNQRYIDIHSIRQRESASGMRYLSPDDDEVKTSLAAPEEGCAVRLMPGRCWCCLCWVFWILLGYAVEIHSPLSMKSRPLKPRSKS